MLVSILVQYKFKKLLLYPAGRNWAVASLFVMLVGASLKIAFTSS